MSINKHNTINTNDTYNISRNSLYNVTGHNYYSKKINSTSNTTNNITGHNHNNYEHNVLNKLHKHITEINYFNKTSLNMKQCYNFYHGNLNFGKIENISLTQQADISNNITETNNQTITYVDNNYLNSDKIATTVVNPTPSLTDHYLWIPETSDNVVLGSDSILTYTQSKYATLAALQSSITNINNTVNTEVQKPSNGNQ